MIDRGLLIAIIFFNILVLTVVLIFVTKLNETQGVIPILLVIITSLGAIILTPLREKITNFISGKSAKKPVYRICLFGRSGTGKTT